MTEQWESWVGRTTQVEDRLDPAQARKMQATLGREATLSDGDVLPGPWHWLYFHDAVPADLIGADGHPRLGVTGPALPASRRMWAGGALAWHGPIVLGRPAVRRSTISAITAKQGRTGSLVFMTIDHVVEQDGDLRVSERQDIVYREAAATSGTAAPETAPSSAQRSVHWAPDTVSLFRYSALTFNSHRIHYDADYARDVEGYPGLVVHGPLLATLLVDLAADHGTLATFDYRAKSPVFLPQDVSVNSAEDGARLWVATGDGALAMEATATYR